MSNSANARFETRVFRRDTLSLQAVSIVFFTETWRPDSFYDRIAANRKLGLHTLCLLDIKVKEPSLEALARGRTVYEAPRCAEAATWPVLQHGCRRPK